MITHTNNLYYVSQEEQETIINFSRMEKAVSVFTSDQSMIYKLDKLCETAPEYYQVTEVTISNVTNRALTKTYLITDKTLITWRKGKMKLSEEQRNILRERIKKING